MKLMLSSVQNDFPYPWQFFFFTLNSLLSGYNITIADFFWWVLLWCIFFFLFIPFVSLYVKYDSSRKHVLVCVFFIHPENLCLLTGYLNHLHVCLLIQLSLNHHFAIYFLFVPVLFSFIPRITWVFFCSYVSPF